MSRIHLWALRIGSMMRSAGRRLRARRIKAWPALRPPQNLSAADLRRVRRRIQANRNSNSTNLPSGPSGQRRWDRGSAADWAQAVGSLLSVLISVIAFIIALRTLGSQQQVTADQLEFNSETRVLQSQRYATRVSWWFTNEDDLGIPSGNLVIGLQNRSPVPIYGVYILLRGCRATDIANREPCVLFPQNWVYMATKARDLPPCTVYTVAIDAPHDISISISESSTDPQPGNFGYLLDLQFSESGRGWDLAPTGLKSRAPTIGTWGDRGKTYTILLNHVDSVGPATDCGEG
jgi:hypothetical protein